MVTLTEDLKVTEVSSLIHLNSTSLRVSDSGLHTFHKLLKIVRRPARSNRHHNCPKLTHPMPLPLH